KDGRLTWDDLNSRVQKVLLAKYNLGLYKKQVIDTVGILADLNEQTTRIKTLLAKNAVTLLQQTNTTLLPLKKEKKIAYVAIGAVKEPVVATRLKAENNADIYLFGTKAEVGKQLMDDKNPTIIIDKSDSATAQKLINALFAKGYDAIVVGMHNYSRRPANNFGLSNPAVFLIDKLQLQNNVISIYFGNPYAIKFSCNALNLATAYEDDDITQHAVADWLQGRQQAKGKLPVTVCDNFRFGDGITYNTYFPQAVPEYGANKFRKIDSIAKDAIAKGAMPGCVILAAKDGKVVYQQAFGTTTMGGKTPVTTNMVYDLASVTKISATTVSVMKLYEDGKLDLDKTLGDYLPWVKGSNKAPLKLRDILLHQAGLNPFIPFYREVIDTASGEPKWAYFSKVQDATHQFRAAENLYVRNNWQDTLYQRIVTSKLTATNKYVYSDNDFIFLGKIVEAVSGKPLDVYVKETFYKPLGMVTTTFHPREFMTLQNMVPTEVETHFRKQLLWGDVHDEGAAMFG
ncbi:MAG: serine hydrolase, partial [Deinococcales bacterium]|nr:serine hydrolase [Chitinophagaceae bacterium]